MGGTTNGGRERAFEALRASEELHRATLGSISDAVFLADDEGAFTFVCPNVDVIFGYTPDEVQSMGRIGRLLGKDLFDPAELEARTEIRNVEREVTTKSGAQRTVLIHLKRVAIQDGTVLYTCRDVTELKHAERELSALRVELMHAARLALVGELTASIVHDIKQPLTAIVANAEAGRRLIDNPGAPCGAADLSEIFRDVLDESHVATDIVDRIRGLARKRPMERRPLDVNDVIRSVLLLVAADAGRRRIGLQTELEESLPAIEGDRVSMQQVLLNLLVNAMDAIEQANSRRRHITVSSCSANGSVKINVADTGPGIAGDQLPLLFDPFYTTKHEGIGLGLAIARTILDAHGARIWAEDRSGEGASFHLELPAVSAPVDGPAAPPV
ncbi:MAG: sensor histidine kinase [Steroidobacteraceae bacterium]